MKELNLPYGNDLNRYAAAIHAIAVEQGYWNGLNGFYYTAANAMGELGEALDEYRDGKPTLYYKDKAVAYAGDTDKPEGLAVEIVDAIIWLLDYLSFLDVDIDDVLRRKIRYNATRGYLHGHKQ